MRTKVYQEDVGEKGKKSKNLSKLVTSPHEVTYQIIEDEPKNTAKTNKANQQVNPNSNNKNSNHNIRKVSLKENNKNKGILEISFKKTPNQSQT